MHNYVSFKIFSGPWIYVDGTVLLSFVEKHLEHSLPLHLDSWRTRACIHQFIYGNI